MYSILVPSRLSSISRRGFSTLKMSLNRLSSERSPYLLQHATNPVEWYPWCIDAFEKSKLEDKLIFLSIGYSTCHWCHVMERESFENIEIAKVMNENYVNIKVDREERPDVDKMYMSFIQAISGTGGWPMSVFLTPELKPIFGGTYFPPHDIPSISRPGFKKILESINDQWKNERSKVLESGTTLIKILGDNRKTKPGQIIETKSAYEKCFGLLSQSYDVEYGGFSKAPKFPQPVNINFLLDVAITSEMPNPMRKKALQMAKHTLDMMSIGGIWDHVSKGFARYSTDREWHVPHFEKMLYDQGQLLSTYAMAFSLTGSKKYATTCNDIVTYITRDLKHPMGGFYSAEDADSYPTVESKTKEEGAFCVWDYKELKSLLNSEQLDAAEKFYGVQVDGNVPSNSELEGKNVLTNIDNINEVNLEIIEEINKILYNARSSRPRPGLDNKILASWNGLMITGLARAGMFLEKPHYIEAAGGAMDFIKNKMFNEENNTLYRASYSDKSEVITGSIQGFLDDYAFVIKACLDLFEAEQNVERLEFAKILQETQDNLFWDNEFGGYFASSSEDKSILIRMKEDQDGAEPCGNSISSHNLLRLYSLLDEEAYKIKAEKLLKNFASQLNDLPIWIPEMTTALRSISSNIPQIIVQCSSITDPLFKVAQKTFIGNRTLVLINDSVNLETLTPKYREYKKSFQDGSSKVYICKNFTCTPPISNKEELIKILKTL